MDTLWLLAHISLLIHAGEDVKGIVENILDKKEKFPSNQEFQELVTDAASFLTSGAITLAPDILKTFQTALAAIQDALTGKAA